MKFDLGYYLAKRSNKGLFYRLYLIIDLFSRKMVGWEIWESEEARHAEKLIKQTVLKERIRDSRWFYTPIMAAL